jgi:GLPGLI family protein
MTGTPQSLTRYVPKAKIMRKQLLFIFSCFFILSGCDRLDRSIKLTYRTEAICHFNDDYNGIDSTYLLVQDSLIKKWNKYDPNFFIINSKARNSKFFLLNSIDNKKYAYEVNDTNRYEINHLIEEKKILGYNCRKVELRSATDTLYAYYTKDFGVNYSPVGFIDGFVMEYIHKTKYFEYQSSVISIDDMSAENIVVPSDYIETTQANYFKQLADFRSKENMLPFVIEGQEAPKFKIPDINDNILDLEQKHGKVLVFNFWFIGCRGCVQEMPDLNKIVEHFKNKNVEFYAFSADSKNAIKSFLRRKQFDFITVPNADIVSHLYGVNGYPTTLIIDKSGNVAKTYNFTLIEMVGLENVIYDIEKVLNE